jgi:UDP-N-acetylglucosamine 2-epimerase (non-hydrolysing)
VLFGTRPEVIKLAPLLSALRADPEFVPVVISTGQHRELLDPVLRSLHLEQDFDLRAMKHNRTLTDLHSFIVREVGRLLLTERAEVLIVHGDTTTAFAGGLAAFYHGVAVAHVEAGIRSGTTTAPFPEELHRYALARLVKWHFAPTHRARSNLVAEGIAESAIEVTGNTVVDALAELLDTGQGASAFGPRSGRRVLATLHRRESQNGNIEAAARAIADIAGDDTEVVILLHKNPAVRRGLLAAAEGSSSARFLEPLPYPDFVRTLADADLVLTDSGGVQEEATALGKRILVLREVTDRPEAVQSGNAKVVGLDPAHIAAAARLALARDIPRTNRVDDDNPFGDGKSAERIVRRLRQELLNDPSVVFGEPISGPR